MIIIYAKHVSDLVIAVSMICTFCWNDNQLKVYVCEGKIMA